MFFMYVLFSKKDKKFYIGYSSNLKRRLGEHFRGESKSTKWRRPLKLVYAEIHLNQRDALRREKYFKTTVGKKSLKLMIRNSLKDLNI